MDALGYIVVGIGIFIVLALVNVGCAQLPGQGRAVGAAENLGIHVTKVERKTAWGVLGGCHENDVTKFVVSGTDASGAKRTIEVCAPFPFGGYTVRN